MYSFPNDSCIFTGDDYDMGIIDIYIPCDKTSCFVFDDENLINVCSSSVTGYFSDGVNTFSVTFQPYQFGRWRKGNSFDYQYLDMTDASINFNTRVPTDNLSIGVCSIIVTGVLGVLLFLTFMKR